LIFAYLRRFESGQFNLERSEMKAKRRKTEEEERRIRGREVSVRQ